ncbi:alpha-beta hydrolase superfamily lysophospholipase [Rhodococcus sp. SMB37]|uniref:alpha/beta fold hydrolase n=1 Tax=Rhodococcus sp. SMB37 TaxID=2512213 RepID=UPI00104A613D|nr:alpha/beta hydrolase [Rhodococcus sp. SMB37]TCN53680.1 alpha-beta hydrolase superfamily lysophospholipase [Rhodococcus sp. SMB37]
MQATPSRTTFRGAGVDLVGDLWTAEVHEAQVHGVVLFLHGVAQTRHSWRRTAARLAPAGWVAYTVDLRGHGDSEWAADGSYGVSAHLADLQEIVRTVRNSNPGLPVAIVGASLGGKVALIGLGEDPDLADILVLVDIAVTVEMGGGRRVREFMKSAPVGFASLEEAAEAVSAYKPGTPRAGNADGLRKNLRLRDGRWYWHWDPAMLAPQDSTDPDAPVSEEIRQRASEASQRITRPVLLVRGQASDVVSAAGVDEMRGLISHLEVIDVREAGHMVTGDDNDMFTAGLGDFLTRAAAGHSVFPKGTG